MRLLALFIGVIGFMILGLGSPAWSVRDLFAIVPGGSQPQTAVAYQTSPVETTEIIKTVKATGTLNPSKSAEVGSQLSGQIAVLAADFNSVVRKGEVLAQLEQSSFIAQVEAARAVLESAKADERTTSARLARALVDVRQAQLQRPILEARVENAKIAHDAAVRDLKIRSLLVTIGTRPRNEELEFITRRDAALATLHEAEANLTTNSAAVEAARADVTRIKSEMDGAGAAVQKAQAQLENAKINLEWTNIRAPFDGIIIGRNVSEGQTLASALEAKTLFVMAADLRRMEIWARVDETDIAKIAAGEDATFAVDAFPGREFRAKVMAVRKAPQVVQNVVTYVVVLEAHNDDYALLPGMTALATIVAERTPASLSVPVAALRFLPSGAPLSVKTKQDRPSVWVLRGNAAPVRVPVLLGGDDGERVAIKAEGIHVGDNVIVGTAPAGERHF